MANSSRLSPGELLELRAFDTPTLHNGWEQFTRADAAREGFNLEALTDYMPALGTMVGYAVTLVIQPGNPEHAKNGRAWSDYRRYIGSIPGPKIVVVQDLDKPRTYGSVWGEVQANIHHQLGCGGAIVDGGVRDIPQMHAVGFKALARRLCVGHAHGTPVRWGCNVEVFGTPVRPGQLIAADRHGFIAFPEADETELLAAVQFMEKLERHTKIAAARSGFECSTAELLDRIDAANREFKAQAMARFSRPGEA